MEEERASTSKNEKILYYGDLILIKSPLNPSFHNKYFFIEYVGLDAIHLIEKESFQKLSFGINQEDGTINDETIELIKIVYRNPERGYARQNKLLPGTYLDIHFATKIPRIITGKIVNLEEDMIEVMILESKKSIFIDFAYRGIAPHYRIKTIKIRNKSEFENLNVNDEGKSNELEDGEVDENEDIEDGEIREDENNENLINIDDVDFGENITIEIEYNVQLNDSEYHYDLKEQKDDLLNDILSSIGTKQRTPKVMDKINRLINRFEQAMIHTSRRNENGNLVQRKFKDKQLEHYINEEDYPEFTQSLHFIMPCVKEINKVIYIDSEDFQDEDEDVDESIIDLMKSEYPTSIVKSMESDLKEFNDNILNIKPQQGQTYDGVYNKLIDNFLMPFSMDENEGSRDKLYKKPIYDVRNSNIQFLNLNSEDIPESLTFHKNQPKMTFGVSDVYTSHDKNMYYDSYLMLPLPYLYQSQRFDPQISLLTKSFMSTQYKMIEPILKNVTINNVRISDSEYLNSKDFYQSHHGSFKEANLLIDDKSEKESYFDVLSPTVDDALTIFKDKELLSYNDVYNVLRLFKLDLDNINAELLNAIKLRISQSITHKKREYSANQKFFSKKLKPEYEVNYDFIDSIYFDQDVGRNYGSLEDIDVDLYNLQEVLHYLNCQDNQSFFHISLVSKNKDLYSTMTDQEINAIISSVKDGSYSAGNMDCAASENKSKKNIVKLYSNEEELLKDNYKTVYVDTSMNNEFKQDLEYYHSIKNKNTNSVIRRKLYDYAMNDKFLGSDGAKQFINEMIQEQKLVKEGDYAVVEKGGDKIHVFYKWVGDHWEKDDDEQDKMCMEQPKCIEEESRCKQIDKLREKREKDLMEQIVETIQDEKLIDREFLIRNIDKLSAQLLKDLIFIRRLKTIHNMRVHDANVKMIQKVKSRNIIESPYEKLKEKILSISDLNEKYQLVNKFVRQYTVPGEDPYYLYCIDTGVKLLPKIVHKMAEGYFLNDEDYASFINRLCLTQGEESDNGDAWVDKYSGYVIKRKDFEEEKVVDEFGNAVVNRSELGDVGLISEPTSIETLKVDDAEDIMQKSIGYKAVQSIILMLMNFSGVQFPKPELKTLLHDCYEDCKKFADKYNSFDEKNMKMKEKNDLIILFYCACYMFVYLQTSIPDIRVRKSFSGCKKSFSGYPLESNDDYSGIQYMACIMTKIKSNSSPWNGLKRVNETKLRDKIVQFMKKEVLKQSRIEKRLIQKRAYLEQENIMNYENNIHYNFIDQFRPMDLLHSNPDELYGVNYEPLQKEAFTDLYSMITRSDYETIESKQFSIQGHIMKQGLLLQKLVQEKVQSVDLLLNAGNGEPFQSNACCNDKNNNPIHYFDSSNDLFQLIEMNRVNREGLSRIIRYKNSNTISLSHALYKKDEDRFTVGYIYNDELIYTGFIKYLNFDHPELPIPDTIKKHFDLEKPDYSAYNHELYRQAALSENQEEIMRQKIDVLKSQNYNFSLSDFKTLMAIVHEQEVIDPNEKMNNIHNLQRQESLISLAQNAEIDPFLMPYIKYNQSKVPFSYVSSSASQQSERDLNNELAKQSTIMVNNIEKLFMGVTILSKDKKTKYISDMQRQILDTPLLKERIDVFGENMEQFIKNDVYDSKLQMIDYYIRLVTIIIPNQIQNFSDKEMNILNPSNIPSHWGFSSKHKSDIQSFSNKYKSLMKRLLGSNEKILATIGEIKDQLSDIYHVYRDGFAGMLTSVYHKKTNMNPVTFYQVSVYIYFKSLSLYMNPLEKNKSSAPLLKLIISIFEIQKEYNKYLSMDYVNIIEKVNKYSEGEKEKKKARLGDMEDDERRTENELKKHKLGVWSRGLKSGLFRYDKDFYDLERQEVSEIEQDMESGMFFEASREQENVFDFEDENYEGNQQSLMDEQREYYDMSRMIAEEDLEDQDDFDYDLGAGGYMQEH